MKKRDCFHGCLDGYFAKTNEALFFLLVFMEFQGSFMVVLGCFCSWVWVKREELYMAIKMVFNEGKDVKKMGSNPALLGESFLFLSFFVSFSFLLFLFPSFFRSPSSVFASLFFFLLPLKWGN